MAYGTDSVRAVDVIVGPGNVYVAVAKREVAGEGLVGVPGAFAGPSEVVVVADDTVPAEWAAVDVVVQAEHGPDGLAWLVTWSEAVADAVTAAVAQIVAASPRRADIEATLDGGGYAVLVDGPEQAVEVANAIAPEHLELMCAGAESTAGARSATPGPCSPGRGRRRRSATTWPAPATSCPRSGRPGSPAASASTTSCAPSTPSPSTRRRWPPSPPRWPPWPRPRAWPPTPTRVRMRTDGDRR